MDGEEEILICGCPNYVGSEEKLPGEEGSVAEEVSAKDLN